VPSVRATAGRGETSGAEDKQQNGNSKAVYDQSLDRDSERLEEFTAINNHLREIIHFPAVDGRTLDLPALTRDGTIKPGILDAYTAARLGRALGLRAQMGPNRMRDKGLTDAIRVYIVKFHRNRIADA
jgi:hypothetical protein